GLKVTRNVGEQLGSKFDLTVYVEEPEDTPYLMIEYNIRLFKEETIRRFMQYYRTILTSVLDDPRRRIADIDFIPPAEKEQLLILFNRTDTAYPEDTTVYRLFQQQVERTPDAPALRSGDLELSYAQLNSRANRLAHLLQARGVKADQVVGIMLNRSLELIETLYAVLKAGGTYLPIDPEYPVGRITSMLTASRSSLLITDTDILENKPLAEIDNAPEIILPTELARELDGQSDQNPAPLSEPGDLIYIIFTSGSTGAPKGAGVFHRGFVNLMNWFLTQYNIGRSDTNLLLTSFSFDLTQKNLYASLLSGGTLVIPTIRHFDPAPLVREISANRVTWINCTPSMFVQMVGYCNGREMQPLESLRWVYLGGEPIVVEPLLEWLESPYCNGKLVNTYGPTECTDISNAYVVESPRSFLDAPIPVGKPIYNVRLYVIDRYRNPLPVGIPGELCISGSGVGIGYVNDSKLTAEKFITAAPNGDDIRLYRTGDLVKWLPDGTIIFIGRLDHQVKIRGFRIELGEIENRLLDHQAIKETLVTAKKQVDGDNYLCAYIVPVNPKAAGDLTPGTLGEFLIKELPDYMVPSYFVILDKMPLNPNGKVDRKALPEPGVTHSIGGRYVPPANRCEEQLTALWSEILNLSPDRIGVQDNFFQLGGHSLKATGLIAAIHKTFSVEISISELFAEPTIRGIRQLMNKTGERIYSSIPPVEEKDYYPLSSAQKRFFVIHRLNPSTITYNLPETLHLEGQLDRSSLEAAVKKLIHRHESLRTSFEIIHGEPVQKIHPQVDFRIDAVDPEQEETPVRPFDLSTAPLLRIRLTKVKENRHIIFFDMHHIISDGVSMAIFTREFMTLYDGREPGPLRLQYKDFSHWQNHWMSTDQLKDQETFWLNRFRDEIPKLELPYDFPRPPLQSHAGDRLGFTLEPDRFRLLERVCLETGTTTFMLLLALFNLLLSRLSGQEDIVVGSATAGRRHQDIEGIIGVFINTLPLRNYPSAQKTFSSFLEDVKENVLQALENQDYQYEELVEKVVDTHDLNRGALFDVMLMVQNMEIQTIEIPGLKLLPSETRQTTSKFDITFTALEANDQLDFIVTYSTALFKRQRIEQFTGYFKRIVSQVLEDTRRTIGDIDILSKEERNQLLYDFNATAADYPREKTIDRLFEEQADRTPHRLALFGTGTGTGRNHPFMASISYKALDEKARRLAGRLRDKGIGPDAIVGLITTPSVETIIMILAVLKAGGAYLPIDPDYPQERIDFMLKDSGAKVIVTNNLAVDGLDGLIVKRINGSGEPTNKPINQRTNEPANLAYIIYTSGTTGNPKGVMIDHRGVVNLVSALKEDVFRYNKPVNVSLISPYVFDASVKQVFPTLLLGHTLNIVPEETRLDAEQLVSFYKERNIRISDGTPAHLNIILDVKEQLGHHLPVEIFVIGGEELKPDLCTRLFTAVNHRELKIMNVYGPTECCDVTTSYTVTRDISRRHRVPIGKPLGNKKTYILSPGGRLQPIGITGELCIGGIGTGKGYLNRQELTKTKFVDNPFEAGETLYRSGDLARWLADGNIEFLGRI
ncbi:MAG: amino acid adenylation domain-containing protein, partial [bacterium]|nr:amino acid adenylation domain-containing protein [bacterium]